MSYPFTKINPNVKNISAKLINYQVKLPIAPVFAFVTCLIVFAWLMSLMLSKTSSTQVIQGTKS